MAHPPGAVWSPRSPQGREYAKRCVRPGYPEDDDLLEPGRGRRSSGGVTKPEVTQPQEGNPLPGRKSSPRSHQSLNG
jgi:hypothetical protein